MKFHECFVSIEKTTSERILGCSILFTESLFEVNRLMVEGQGGLTTTKVGVDRQ